MAMNTRLHGEVKVESLRNHSREDLRALEELFARGADARADAHHKDFYEVEDASRVYYVFLSPVSGRVILVAEWPKGKDQDTPTVLAKRAFCTA
jgi:hypothetical protein